AVDQPFYTPDAQKVATAASCRRPERSRQSLRRMLRQCSGGDVALVLRPLSRLLAVLVYPRCAQQETYMADAKTVLEFAKKNEVKILDLRFSYLPGLWHHVSYPIDQLSEASFEEGFGMDGSSIRGWAAIHESDMVLIPDPNTYMLDPFTEQPTLVMTCDVIDPVTKQRYDRDPRYIARKAEMYLGSTGMADTAYFGAEAEFFIFDNIRFDQREQHGFYFIDAEEGRWNSGRLENNLGYRPRYKEGYFPVPPTDHYQDLRTEMVMTMENCGLVVECHHHEVATGGQTEIDLK